MRLAEAEAYRRLVQAARSVDPALAVDRGSVHWVDDPYPGAAFGLALGGAHALLFAPEADIAGPDWPARLVSRLEAARDYLLGFAPAAR
ncbi:MAG: hypothetical protein QN168_09425 [Armatimonadota bacterium]|nr:hypothetical protein [Armatimonadota bacterium]